MEQLAEELAGEAIKFIVVYTREAHPQDARYGFGDILQTRSLKERRDLVERLLDEVSLGRLVLIDEMENRVTQLYSGFPNRSFVIDPDGIVRYAAPWEKADEIRTFLQEVLEK